MTAYLHLTSTDRRDLDGANGAASALDDLGGNERERAHLAAIRAWAAGDWTKASGLLDDLLTKWPTDMLALLVGHQLDFFLGDATNLRDRVGRSLGALEPGHHHHGFMLGMHAFGLEEVGHYEQAEAAGLASAGGASRRRVGDPRRGARLRDAWLCGPRHRVHDADRVELGCGQPVHRAPVVAPGAVPARAPAGRSRCWPSTTASCTTATRRVCRSRCSTPARCCGVCTSTAVDTGDRFAALADAWSGWQRWRNPGTSSTTCTR